MREHDDSRFRAPLPYPEVRVARPNSFYARVLHDDFAGRASELTAILQYLYHHWVSGPGGEEIPDLAGLYKGIAMVEMSHFEMLAETILLLGGRPAFTGSDGRLWSPADVYLGEGVCDRLAANLAGEEEAIATYQRQAAFVRDPYVSALLLRIAKDEEVHAHLLRTALERYCPLQGTGMRQERWGYGAYGSQAAVGFPAQPESGDDAGAGEPGEPAGLGPEGPAEAVERGPVLEPAQEPPGSRPREQAGPRPAGSAAVSAPALEEAVLRTLPASPEAPAAREAADRRAGESRRPPRPRRPPWLIR